MFVTTARTEPSLLDAQDYLARELAKLRIKLGITQPMLAERLGVTRTTLANWEGGIRRPSHERLRTWAHELGADVNVEVTIELNLDEGAA